MRSIAPTLALVVLLALPGTMDRIRLGACNHDISDGPVRVRIQRRVGDGAWTTLSDYTA